MKCKDSAPLGPVDRGVGGVPPFCSGALLDTQSVQHAARKQGNQATQEVTCQGRARQSQKRKSEREGKRFVVLVAHLAGLAFSQFGGDTVTRSMAIVGICDARLYHVAFPLCFELRHVFQWMLR